MCAYPNASKIVSKRRYLSDLSDMPLRHFMHFILTVKTYTGQKGVKMDENKHPPQIISTQF